MATPASETVDSIAGGVRVETRNGLIVALTAHSRGIFHVTARPKDADPRDPSAALMVPAPPPPETDVRVTRHKGLVTVAATNGSAEIDTATGRVNFRDRGGNLLLESSKAPVFRPVKVEDGDGFLSVSQQFNRGTTEAAYGLGQHQQLYSNVIGHDVELRQQNMIVAMPFLVSTRNYGLLWDNNGAGRFGTPEPYQLLGSQGEVSSEGGSGFKAEYFLGDQKVTERREPVIDLRFANQQDRWPVEARKKSIGGGAAADAGAATDQRRVVWTGSFRPGVSGDHRFRLNASGYVKMWVNGKLMVDGWRPNFNPWDFELDAALVAGKPASIRIEWLPKSGFLGLLHSDPLPEADRNSVWLTSDVARELNYWFVPGTSSDDVIRGYRTLTGKSVMLPKWAYGFWQSRQRYKTQDEFLTVAKTYRDLKIPIDVLVQDWFYWPENAWGSHRFEKSRFPSPGEMVAKAHSMNLRVPISVWAKFYPETANYRELDAKGAIHRRNIELGNKDWVGAGYRSTFYDAFSPIGRDIYWRQIKDGLVRHGFDGWWLDADEPAIQSNVSLDMATYIKGPTALGSAAETLNAYSLPHMQGVYEGSLAARPDVRPLILTRSAMPGAQRYGAVLWSGDTGSTWRDLKAQITSGINVSATGLPNWTHDIGGYSPDLRFKDMPPGSALEKEWRELNVRWFQFGAFTPVFRSHGEGIPREVYLLAPPGSVERDTLVDYIHLRYRLMPYFYSLAGATWTADASIMRGLAADYPNDLTARESVDQYLLGRELLVAPVTDYQARSRKVYLPGPDDLWYGFDNSALHRGGRWIVADAPLSKMPVFVRAGSVIPIGPVRQHVGDLPGAPTTLVVYTGRDGASELYDDDGTSEEYRRGAFSRIPITYDDRAGTLTLGDRLGRGFAGMSANQEIRVCFVRPGVTLNACEAGSLQRTYTGRKIVIRRPDR